MSQVLHSNACLLDHGRWNNEENPREGRQEWTYLCFRGGGEELLCHNTLRYKNEKKVNGCLLKIKTIRSAWRRASVNINIIYCTGILLYRHCFMGDDSLLTVSKWNYSRCITAVVLKLWYHRWYLGFFRCDSGSFLL